MPFFSYAFYRGTSKNHDGQTHRYAIVTPDRKTADLLYRGIQEQQVFWKGGVELYVQRLSSRMWTFEATASDDLIEFITYFNNGIPSQIHLENDHFKGLSGKVYLQMLGNLGTTEWPAIQPFDLADHISGANFFIRNKFAPQEFWYLEDGQIRISTRHRSRFCIKLAKESTIKDLVMVETDKVVMTHVHDGDSQNIYFTEDGYPVTKAHGGHKQSFPFGALNGGFVTKESDVNGTSKPKLAWEDEVSGQIGEVWELC
jgi:hypothetical protein